MTPTKPENEEATAEARSEKVIDQIFDSEESEPVVVDARAERLAAHAHALVDQLEAQLATPATIAAGTARIGGRVVEATPYLDTGRIAQMPRRELEAHASARGLLVTQAMSDFELRELVRRSRSVE